VYGTVAAMEKAHVATQAQRDAAAAAAAESREAAAAAEAQVPFCDQKVANRETS
jgi:hypothetical protein